MFTCPPGEGAQIRGVLIGLGLRRRLDATYREEIFWRDHYMALPEWLLEARQE